MAGVEAKVTLAALRSLQARSAALWRARPYQASSGGPAWLTGGDDDDDDKESRSNLPERINEFSGIRLTPGARTLEPGEFSSFSLQVRAKEDGKWYSVTGRSTSTIELRGTAAGIVKRDGTKNTFGVPIDAAKGFHGKAFVVVGTYNHPGQAPMTATARISVGNRQAAR